MSLVIVSFVLAVAVLGHPGLSRGQGESETGGAPETGLRRGMVLGSSNAELAKDLLPPEIYQRYKSNDYRNEIADWPAGMGDEDPGWAQASEQNVGVLGLTEAGTIVDARTGEQPPYVYGTPFPHVDPGDPKAAMKIVWNYFFNQVYRNGNTFTVVNLTWVSPHAIDRTTTQEVFFKYYDGVPPELREDNPANFSLQFISQTTSPKDLFGTTALSWRFRDADKRDTLWAYVPAMRRVRAVSPANRSDGSLGSDMSQDDGPFFDGKVEDFDWKLVGERETLCFVDPFRVEGRGRSVSLEEGGYRVLLAEVPNFGFQVPSWDGVAWAPVGAKLAARSAWVVEARPKDSHYLYGRVELWIDRVAWMGCWNRKFSWTGELLNHLYSISGPGRKGPDGKYAFLVGPGSGISTNTATNLKTNRATVAHVPPSNPRDHMVPYAPAFFDYQTLHRFGR